MTALWLDRAVPAFDTPLPEDGRFDDVVVGGGITGLTTGLLLARAGRKVGVIEAGRVGGLTTGHTTAKVSLLQGTKLSSMLQHTSRTVAEAYVEANTQGLAWLTRFCDDHDVDYQRRDAVTFAASPQEVSKVRQEHQAAESLGLEVRWEDRLPVPFPSHGGTVLGDQVQLDPVELVQALATQLRAHGGTIHEGLRVRSVSKTGRPELHLEDGSTVHAEHVVLATGAPILDRGLYFAKLEPQRSYLLAYAGAEAPPGMYISAGSSSRSLRDVPDWEGSPMFLVGGSGHTVGRTRSEAEHVDELRAWAAKYFPRATETHAWSAQDYSTHDGVPHVGRLPRGLGHIYVATGYDKWGMTNGVAAGLALAGQMLGSRPSWATTLQRRVTRPRGAFEIARMNAGVAASAAAGYAAVAGPAVDDRPEEGTGDVGRDGVVPTGTATVDGRTCKVAAICTHLGGPLKWNDQERSWDCLWHGSRFEPDGEVIEGPATRPLKRRD